jgi:hypothetical protein
MQAMVFCGRTESDVLSESAYHEEGTEERRAHRRDYSRPLPQPLSHESISSVQLELQPGMSKAVEICYDCWKVHCNRFVLVCPKIESKLLDLKDTFVLIDGLHFCLCVLIRTADFDIWSTGIPSIG